MTKKFDPFGFLNDAIESIVTQPHAFLALNEKPLRQPDYSGSLGTGPRIGSPESSTVGLVKYVGPFVNSTNTPEIKIPVSAALAAGAVLNIKFDRVFNYLILNFSEGGAFGDVSQINNVFWRARLNTVLVTDWVKAAFPGAYIDTSGSFNGSPVGSLGSGGASITRSGHYSFQGFIPRIAFDELDIFNNGTTTCAFFPWVIKEPFHPILMPSPSP